MAATSAAGAVVSYTPPKATDVVDGVRPASCVPASGSTFAMAQTATVTCTASDTHGNTATAHFTVTVSVTSAALSSLTTQDVQSSANYQHLNSLAKLLVNVLVTVTSNVLTNIGPLVAPAQKEKFISAYQTDVQALVTPGWLTQTQATNLENLASQL